MSRLEPVYQWMYQVASHLPELSPSQARVLARWSVGMVVARSCSLSAVSLVLAVWHGRPQNTVRQQVREFYYEATAKRGEKRRALEVTPCFAPLLRWVLAGAASQQVALAMDATSLGDRFAVLAISVVYRGCAIPVAWRVLRAGARRAWCPEWLALLAHLAPAIPADWTVIVLADRGLYARWLFQAIAAQGWHPFLRVNLGGTFRPTGCAHFRPFAQFVPAVGRRWQGTGTAFSSRHLSCTLLAYWAEGCKDPWLVLTDLLPGAADVGWYGLRAWVEHGFKQLKGGGFQWQQTRITDPDRATRLWLALAVATLWAVRVGGEADATLPESTLPPLDTTSVPLAAPTRPRIRRTVSLFRRGCLTLLVTLLAALPLPPDGFHPETWPSLDVRVQVIR